MTKTNLLLSLFLVLAFFSCDRNSTDPDTNPVGDPAKLVEMNHTLGWKMFEKEQLAKPDENVLISPLSIQTALDMALNGAKGNTREEILSMMGCSNCSVDDLNQLHKDLANWLTEQSGPASLTIANGFFYDQSRMSVKQPFTDALADFYQGSSKNVNFDAEQTALDEINGWVKNNTNQKIDKILDKITALDVAFLINALHFKADWATGFSPDMTSAGPFTKKSGSQITTDFVGADRNFTFAQTANFNLVDIPFKDSVFSVSLIQPSAQNTNADWHLGITPQSWNGMYSGAAYDRAMVFFPKLKLAYENDLIASLKTLGVEEAFSEQKADFTDMGTASNNIFISQIKHKAILNIDEKGAEGAAVTSIGFSQTSAPPTFRFNNPFVLVLRHVSTNAIIFMGYVADPSL